MSNDFRDKLRRITAGKGWEDRLFRKIAGPEKDLLSGKPKVFSHLDEVVKRAEVWMPKAEREYPMYQVGVDLAEQESTTVFGLGSSSPQTLFWSKSTAPNLSPVMRTYNIMFDLVAAMPGSLHWSFSVSEEKAEKLRREKDERRQRIEAFKKRMVAAAQAPQQISEPVSEDKSPDYTECFTGYRAWNVSENFLTSVGDDGIWYPRQAVPATCREGECYPVPNYDCTCGYYSYKDFDHFMSDYAEWNSETLFCFGPVYVWGRVVETERGWRSQYAYPKEIWCLNREHAKLGGVYNVPVRVLEERLAKRDEVQEGK